MINKKLKTLLIVGAVLTTACSVDSNQNISDNHSKKTQITYHDDLTTDTGETGPVGPMKMKRVIVMAMDYANSDGLSNVTSDVQLKYGQGLTVTFKATHSQECSGGSVLVESRLFKKTNYQQPDEKEEEIQSISDGDFIFLNQTTYYFIRVNVAVSGRCTAFKSSTSIEVHF